MAGRPGEKGVNMLKIHCMNVCNSQRIKKSIMLKYLLVCKNAVGMTTIFELLVLFCV